MQKYTLVSQELLGLGYAPETIHKPTSKLSTTFSLFSVKIISTSKYNGRFTFGILMKLFGSADNSITAVLFDA